MPSSGRADHHNHIDHRGLTNILRMRSTLRRPWCPRELSRIIQECAAEKPWNVLSQNLHDGLIHGMNSLRARGRGFVWTLQRARKEQRLRGNGLKPALSLRSCYSRTIHRAIMKSSRSVRSRNRPTNIFVSVTFVRVSFPLV